ncbi:hypothetical protein WAI453_003878 [Rhynchosporium graminicola]
MVMEVVKLVCWDRLSSNGKDGNSDVWFPDLGKVTKEHSKCTWCWVFVSYGEALSVVALGLFKPLRM